MRWKDRRESENVEDRRFSTPQAAMMGGGLMTIVLMLLVAFLGGDPRQVAQLPGGAGGGQAQAIQVGGKGEAPVDDENSKMIKTVLADTEDVWNEIFPKAFGRNYVEPKLVLFTGQVRSACGAASAAVGPFYCPGDQKVYLDLGFFEEMHKKFKAPGDFAQAYVVAHEIGHHVQKLLGISDQFNRARQRLSEGQANALSVRVELQADYLAGVWAHHMQNKYRFLEQGDIEEALNAANAIGDDTLQKRSQGYVVPDAFTHGTSEQRVKSFADGLRTGDVSQEKLQYFFDSPQI